MHECNANCSSISINSYNNACGPERPILGILPLQWWLECSFIQTYSHNTVILISLFVSHLINSLSSVSIYPIKSCVHRVDLNSTLQRHVISSFTYIRMLFNNSTTNNNNISINQRCTILTFNHIDYPIRSNITS